MSFAETLKQYMGSIPCSASELSAVSGLAPSMISRYLRSEQMPGDKAIRKLAAGLDFLSRDKGGPSLDLAKVTQTLTESLYGLSIDYSLFIKNLHHLLDSLNVNNNEIARALNFDPSYISRILAGTRKPANIYQFLTNISDYITNRFFGTPYVSIIAETIECDSKELSSKELLSFNVRRYLGSHTDPASEIMPRFLVKLDSFDLEEFIKERQSSGFATLPSKRPKLPQHYLGLTAIRQACLDFLDATLLSRISGDVILYCDIPPADSEDHTIFSDSFAQKLQLLTEQDHTIRNIHDVHRSFSDLLNELLQWLPLYMTGKVRSYYFSEPTNHTFMHTLCSSGAACVSGEAVFGNPNGTRSYLSGDLDNVSFMKERAGDLLSLAHPLLDIYNASRRDEFIRDKRAMFLPDGNYIMVRSVPPLFSMSASLLERILKRSALTEEQACAVRTHYARLKENFEEIVALGTLRIDLPKARENESLYLSLPGLFADFRIPYTAEGYAEHIRDLQNYASSHPSVTITYGHETILKNTEILICSGKGVLISKANNPEIHFLIYYPSLVHAFETFAGSA